VAYFISLSILPVASRLSNNATGQKTLYQRSTRTVIMIAFPISAGLWLVAPDLIVTAFGIEFGESISVLRILAIVLGTIFFTSLLGTFLIACDKQTIRVRMQWITVCVNVGANLILIPRLGPVGAAIATLLSESVLLILYVVQLKSVLGWPKVVTPIAISSIATLSFIVPFSLLDEASLIITILCGVVIYVVVVSLFPQIRNNELSYLLQMFRGKRNE